MDSFLHTIRSIARVFRDALTFMRLCFRPKLAVAAENLFLRKQLGLFVERKVRPRRPTDAIRFTLARLSCLFDWRDALTAVKPDTLIRWHRRGFRLFWKWSPAHAVDLEFRPSCEPDRSNGNEQPDLGEERIADELLLKIGIRVSPRTVRRYMPKVPLRAPDPKQRWTTEDEGRAISDSIMAVNQNCTTRRVRRNRPAAAHRDNRRAWIILNRADGLSQTETALKVGVRQSVVVQWERRFRESGIAGLSDAKGRGRKPQIAPQVREKIIVGRRVRQRIARDGRYGRWPRRWMCPRRQFNGFGAPMRSSRT